MNTLDNKTWRWILFLAVIICLVVALPTQVRARPPQAITLLYFFGTGQDNAILLEWATATEFETAGFVIDRADDETGPYSEQIGFIPSEGGGIIGAEYEALDDVNVVNGETYWYILVEIENDGTRNETDPISVTAGIPIFTPTYTPTSQPTTSSNQSTSTPPPSQTPTATGTAQSSPTPTNTAVAQQPTSQSGSPAQPTTTAGNNTQTNNSTGNTSVAEASSPNNPYPPAQASPSATFVPDPGQANAAESEPYPGPESEGVQEEGYPAGSNPEVEDETGITPEIQPQSTSGVRALGTQPPLNQQTPGETEQAAPGSSNTIFLWIGFTAAFLIFVGGVIGSIMLFTRRSNQK